MWRRVCLVLWPSYLTDLPVSVGMGPIGGRGVLHVPRMAGVWGAGVPMAVESGVLGSVALIPHK